MVDHRRPVALGLHAGTDPVGEQRRVLAEIAGYHAGDPFVEVRLAGMAARVAVTTYGSSCNAKADTEVSLQGLTATVVPYNFAPPHGTSCPRDLRAFVHEVTIPFSRSGAAQIRVRGIDRRTRSAANLIGDTITVERSVSIP